MELAGHRVSVGGNAVDLTATEFALLRALALNAGRIVTHKTLVRQVWSGRQRGGQAPAEAERGPRHPMLLLK